MNYLGTIDSPYLLHKIRGFVKNAENMAKKKFKT